MRFTLIEAQDARKRVEEIALSLTGKERDAIIELQTIHYNLFGEYIKINCGRCIMDAYYKIKLLTNEELIHMENQKFKLKPDTLLQVFGEGVAYTNDNITDERAVDLIKSNIKYANFFVETPELAALLEKKKVKHDEPVKHAVNHAPVKPVHPAKKSKRK